MSDSRVGSHSNYEVPCIRGRLQRRSCLFQIWKLALQWVTGLTTTKGIGLRLSRLRAEGHVKGLRRHPCHSQRRRVPECSRGGAPNAPLNISACYTMLHCTPDRAQPNMLALRETMIAVTSTMVIITNNHVQCNNDTKSHGRSRCASNYNTSRVPEV